MYIKNKINTKLIISELSELKFQKKDILLEIKWLAKEGYVQLLTNGDLIIAKSLVITILLFELLSFIVILMSYSYEQSILRISLGHSTKSNHGSTNNGSTSLQKKFIMIVDAIKKSQCIRFTCPL